MSSTDSPVVAAVPATEAPAATPAVVVEDAATPSSAAPSTPAAPAATDAAAVAAPATDAPASAAAAAAAAAAGPSPSTSLYVGELDPSVTEAMLYEIFSMVGTVASIRVCRDAVTRRSLGYAYVNYLNSNDGERALEQLNYSLIKNRPCRIMWSQRDPAMRKTGTGNIFIKNLDENIDNKALHDTFAAFGIILSCKVAVDNQGNSLGYGFVHYDSGEAAQAAIEGVNDMLLNDKIVYVGIHVPKRERQAKIDEVKAHYTNLYVKNVALDVTQAEFKELFDAYGTVTSAVVTLDDEGKSKGFGFVNYDNHDDAHKALTDLHEKEFRGQVLFVTRAQRKGEREEELKRSHEQKKYETTLKYQGVNLYVKNLDDDITEEQLQAEFEPFGSITSCKIMVDDKLVSKGFGFVCFSAPDEATKAVTELNGKMIGTKPLYVSLAQRKDVRKSQLEAQVAQRNQIRTQQLQASGLPGLPPYMPGQPMYYGAPAGYAQPGRGGPMGYPQPGPNGPPRPRFYAPQMPGMPMGPGYQQMPQQYSQYLPPPPGAPRGAPRPGGPGMAPPLGRPAMPMVNGQPPMPRAGAPVPAGAPLAGQQPPRGAPAAGAPRPGGPGGYKVNAGVRNPEEPAGLTAAMLANASPASQKQLLGEALYPKIHASQPELAGKLTGMLLEMDSAEILYLLENADALASKVQEGLDVLAEFASRVVPAEA